MRSFVYGDFLFDQVEGKITVGKLKCTAKNYKPVMDYEKEIDDLKAAMEGIYFIKLT